MDRDGNLPGFFQLQGDAGSRLGQNKAVLKPRGRFELTLVPAEDFQAWVPGTCAVSIAAKG